MATEPARRILFAVSSLDCGGAERGLIAALRSLDRSRFEPTVCWINRPGQLVSEVLANGVPVVGLGRRGRWDVLAWIKAWRLVRKLDIDVVHCVQFTAGLWFLAPAALAGVRGRIYAIHGMPEVDCWYVRLLERLCIKPFASHVISVSAAAARQFTARYDQSRTPVTVIRNGIEPSPAGSCIEAAPSGTLVVAAVGRLEKVKGLDCLLDAFSDVHRQVPSCELWLIGEGSERGNLERQAAALDLGEVVRFLGFRRDASALLARADVFVSASRSECLPNVHLEAMAMERAIVATGVGGVLELLDPSCAVLVKPDAPAELARALIGVLEDTHLRRRLAVAARARVRTFSHTARMAQLQELWTSLASRRPAHQC